MSETLYQVALDRNAKLWAIGGGEQMTINFGNEELYAKIKVGAKNAKCLQFPGIWGWSGCGISDGSKAELEEYINDLRKEIEKTEKVLREGELW